MEEIITRKTCREKCCTKYTLKHYLLGYKAYHIIENFYFIKYS